MIDILFRGKRVENKEWIKGLIKVNLVDGDIKKFLTNCSGAV